MKGYSHTLTKFLLSEESLPIINLFMSPFQASYHDVIKVLRLRLKEDVMRRGKSFLLLNSYGCIIKTEDLIVLKYFFGKGSTYRSSNTLDLYKLFIDSGLLDTIKILAIGPKAIVSNFGFTFNYIVSSPNTLSHFLGFNTIKYSNLTKYLSSKGFFTLGRLFYHKKSLKYNNRFQGKLKFKKKKL